MALDVEFAATIDVGVAANVIRLMRNEQNVNELRYRGCLVLVSGSRVYVGFNQTDVNTDETQELDKVWLDLSQVVIVRIPRSVDMFTLKCAVGSAKCFYVED
jgi:uncharacterized protein YggL (DUF469 family)